MIRWVVLLMIPATVAASPCDHRPGCTVVRESAAGTDARGRKISVIEVSLPRGEDPCDPVEHWVDVVDKGKHDTKKILSLCNDGYGAAGVGEDDVTVEKNRLTHTQYGGSSWRWGETIVYQLSPLVRLSETHDGFWTLGPNVRHDEWRWADLSGQVTWWSPPCPAEETRSCDSVPAEVDQCEGEATGKRPLAYSYRAVPSVSLDLAAWKTTALGSCAALVDGKTGFTIHGKGGPKDSAFRVLAVDGKTLLVEVEDDVWRGPSAKWLFDDHLELWLGEASLGYMDHCLDADSTPPKQWGIRIADGQVFPAFGKPTQALTVERVQVSPQMVRLKIGLPAGFSRFTLVYSDSDDGVRQERLISTSRLVLGKPATLGELRPVDPAIARCEVKGDHLEVRVLPLP